LVARSYSTTDWTIHLGPTGDLRVRVDDSAGANQVSYGPTVADGKPHHVAVTIDDSTRTILMYVDGALRATGGYSGTLAQAGSGGSLVIGSAADGAASFQGSLDEVAYYNKVLDASRIRA